MTTDESELRSALRTVFRSEIAAAPPLPPKLALLARPASRARSTRTRLVATGVAAAALIALAFAFFPSSASLASARDAVAAAAANFDRLDDATLELTLTSPAVDLLSHLFEDEPREYGAPLGEHQYLRVKRPNRFLVYGGVHDVAALATTKPAAGFDGEHAWSLDAAKNVVSFGKIEIRSDGGTSSMNLNGSDGSFDVMHLLSFDFVRELASGSDALQIEEITSPFDKRADRRTFRVSPQKSATTDDSPVWSESTVTIDPHTNLIEHFALKVSFGSFDLFRVTAQLVGTNEGIDDAQFDWRTFAPDATIEPAPAAATPAPEPPSVVREAEPPSTDPESRVLTATGLEFAALESKLRRSIVSTDTAYGLRARVVAAGSPAAVAGIEPGDIVLKWDGKELHDVAELDLWIRAAKPAAKVVVTVARPDPDWKPTFPAKSAWLTDTVTLSLPGAPRNR